MVARSCLLISSRACSSADRKSQPIHNSIGERQVRDNLQKLLIVQNTCFCIGSDFGVDRHVVAPPVRRGRHIGRHADDGNLTWKVLHDGANSTLLADAKPARFLRQAEGLRAGLWVPPGLWVSQLGSSFPFFDSPDCRLGGGRVARPHCLGNGRGFRGHGFYVNHGGRCGL